MKGAFAVAALVAATASFQGADAFMGPSLKGTCGWVVEWDLFCFCVSDMRFLLLRFLLPVATTPIPCAHTQAQTRYTNVAAATARGLF